MIMSTTRRTLLAAAALLPATPALAQRFERPLRIIVPYAAGGAADIVGRMAAERLSPALGQPVVVENRPGANTIIGAQAVLQAEPDGHTLFLASGASLVLNPLLYRRLPYDAGKFALLSVAVETPLVAVVNPRLPVTDLASFVTHAKAEAGRMNYASVGAGNPIQLAAEMFRARAGFEMTGVNYPGSAPALAALLAGDVQVMFDVIATSLPLIRAGQLRALAVTTAARVPALPDVPTIAESGFPGYRATTWFGFATPREAPAAVLSRLSAELNRLQGDAAFRARFEALGLIVPPPQSLEQLAAFRLEERDRWAEVIRMRGIVLD